MNKIKFICNHVYKNQQYVPMVREMSQIHVLSLHIFQIHFNIISSTTSRFWKWSISLRIAHQNSICICVLHTGAIYSTHLSLLYLTTWIIFGEEYKSWTPSVYEFPYYPATSVHLGPTFTFTPQAYMFKGSQMNLNDRFSFPKELRVFEWNKFFSFKILEDIDNSVRENLCCIDCGQRDR
jgi:hypothetical protein